MRIDTPSFFAFGFVSSVVVACSLWLGRRGHRSSVRFKETEDPGTVISELRFDFLGVWIGLGS